MTPEGAHSESENCTCKEDVGFWWRTLLWEHSVLSGVWVVLSVQREFFLFICLCVVNVWRCLGVWYAHFLFCIRSNLGVSGLFIYTNTASVCTIAFLSVIFQEWIAFEQQRYFIWLKDKLLRVFYMLRILKENWDTLCHDRSSALLFMYFLAHYNTHIYQIWWMWNWEYYSGLFNFRVEIEQW